MPVNYSIAMMGNPVKKDDPKKAYAKAQVARGVSIKELSRLVASQTTVSRADVSAVLIATVENMINILRAGNQVELGDLGKFRLQITSNGAESAEKFTASQITGVNIQYIPGEDLKTLFEGIEFVPVPTRAATRAVLKAQKEGKTTVDISVKATPDDKPKPKDDGKKDGSGDNENPLG